MSCRYAVGNDRCQYESYTQTFERGRFAEAPSSSPSRHNLPLQPTPFMGREQELAEVIALLEPHDARLVTLVGPGGMGKTRLAIEAARALLDGFSGGVFFVPLASLADPSQIVSGVAGAVGYSFSGPEDPKRQLLNFLREKSLLLILDGFEHLTEGTALLADIVTEAPGVNLLATSRERLQLRFESLYECGGMRVPTPGSADDARSFGAIRLFETSARRARPDFELTDDNVGAVVDICRLVMGMPLGIELAAAWIAMLSPQEILEEVKKSLDFLETEMRDVPERHRSVRAVFDSSWNLLKPDERDALARLTVFRGGFDRNAANEVSGAGLRTLARLVSKSLLKRNPAGRYEQHDLVQQFAREHVEHSHQAEPIRERHADYFCVYAERLEQRLRGRTQARALVELEQELDNVRATWEWALETNRLDARSRLVESLFRFFEMKGRFREGQNLFGETAALIRGESDAAQVLRARLLARQGRFGHRLGGCQQAREIFEKSLAIARERGLKGEVAFCLQNLADVTSLLGEYETSTALAKDALTVCEEIGDRWTMESVLNNLGVVSYQQEKFDDAAKHYRESLEIAREIGDLWGLAFALNNLGVLAHDGGRFEEAKNRYLESLRVCEDMGDPHGIAAAHINLGRMHYELGEPSDAKVSATKGLELSKELGDSWGTIASLVNLGELDLAGGDTNAARRRFVEGLERAREIRATPLILEALVGVAEIARVEGRDGTAIELLAHVAAHSATDPETRDRAALLVTSFRESSTETAFTEAKNRGQSRRLEELVNEILAEAQGPSWRKRWPKFYAANISVPTRAVSSRRRATPRTRS